MKIGIDIGHNTHGDLGAVGIRVEGNLNIEVGNKVIEKLRALGHTVIETKPTYASNQGDSLYKRVLTANQNNVDFFASIHFNAGGGRGTEVFAISQEGIRVAQQVVNEIAALGYMNRGVKDGRKLYVVKNTNAPAVLIECAFVDSEEDMNLYNAEDIANAIVRGLTGSETPVNPVNSGNTDLQNEEPEQSENGNEVTSDIVSLQKVLNRIKVTDYTGEYLKVDGINGSRTISAIKKLQGILGISKDGIAGAITWKGINSITAKPTLSTDTANSSAVRYVQWRVGANIDGIYGTQTKNAVIIFQSNNKLAPDGIVGTNTWAKLIG